MGSFSTEVLPEDYKRLMKGMAANVPATVALRVSNSISNLRKFLMALYITRDPDSRERSILLYEENGNIIIIKFYYKNFIIKFDSIKIKITPDGNISQSLKGFNLSQQDTITLHNLVKKFRKSLSSEFHGYPIQALNIDFIGRKNPKGVIRKYRGMPYCYEVYLKV